MRRVAEFNKLFHSVLVHVPDGDLGGARLGQLAREHGAEVRAARGEYHPVPRRVLVSRMGEIEAARMLYQV